MRAARGVLAALSLLLAAEACHREPPPPSGQARPIDPAAVRALLDQQSSAWSKGDLEGFLGGYLRAPALVVIVDGMRVEGWEALRARYLKRFGAPPSGMGTLSFSGVEVEPLGDAALARGRWSLALPDEDEQGGLFTLLLKATNDGLRIVHDHTSSSE